MTTPLIQTYTKTKDEMTNQKTLQNTEELQEAFTRMADSGTYDGEPKIVTCSEVLALALGSKQRCCT